MPDAASESVGVECSLVSMGGAKEKVEARREMSCGMDDE